MAADENEKSRTGQRRNQAKSFTHGSKKTIGVAQLLGRDEHGEERRLGRSDEGAGDTVEEHREVDDPHVGRISNGEERQDAGGAQEVDHDEKGTTADAVDHHARERGKEGRHHAEEKRQSGRGIGVGQFFDPNPERQEH